jgi:integrase
MSTALATRLDQHSIRRFGKGDDERARAYILMTAAFLEGRNPNTKSAYETALRQFFSLFKWISPEDVTIAHGAAFKKWLIERKGVSETTAYFRLSALRSYFDFLCLSPSASGEPLIRSNPIRHVPRNDIKPTPYSNAKVLTWGKFVKMIESIPPTPSGLRNKALLIFYAYTGRRRQEVVRLRVKDLDVKARPRTYKAKLKGGQVKTFELPEPVFAAIQAYWIASDRLKDLHSDSPVFAGFSLDQETSVERPLHLKRVNEIMASVAKQAGVDLEGASIHSLRHMVARDLDRAGLPLQDIQEMLGHLSANTTQIYIGRIGRVAPAHTEALERVRALALEEARHDLRE